MAKRPLFSRVALLGSLVAIACAAGCATGVGDGSGTGGNTSAEGGASQSSGGSVGSTGGSSATATGGVTGAGGTGPSMGSGGVGGKAGLGGTTGAGGSSSHGGATGQGGSAAGTSGKGGATGSGGSAGAPGSGGHEGSGAGTGGQVGTGGTMSADKVFNPCRFHFGTIDSVATKNPSIIPQIDYFTPGWMGQKDTFDMSSVCTEANAGGALAGKVPVIVAYVAAFYAKRHFGLCDCNVSSCGANNDLCHSGAADITNNLASIVNVYKSYAQGFASCYGTTKPIVFEMEPDFYQYTDSGETAPWTFAQAGQIMSQFVNAIKTYLPNAAFSMDISPWVGTNNNTGGDGTDNGKNWYSYFDLSLFTFINTSGGGTNAATAKIRGDGMTWAGVNAVTGKPILADTGYGVGGSAAGPDPAWDNATNINTRITDGVLGVAQYTPASTWGSTIAAVRSQLNTPRYCP